MSETVGQQLKQARLAKKLSLDKVVQATRIQARYLEALEADDFDSLPSAVQARGFLKLYADYLGLSLEELLNRQRAAVATPPEPAPAPEATPAASSQTTSAPESTPHPKQTAIPTSTPAEAATATPPADTPAPPSQAIFTEIGAVLRQRREMLGISLNEAEKHTFVRGHYLEAIENGEFARLPSPVQGRGMLQNYARFLDLDVEAILLRYAEGLQLQLQERLPKNEPEKKRQPLIKIALPDKVRRYLSVDMLVGFGLGLFLIVLVLWSAGRILRTNAAATPQPTAPSILEILIASPETGLLSPTSSPASESTETVTEITAPLEVTLPPAGSEPIQVVLVASRNAWVRVSVDGKVEFEGRLAAGSAYAFGGNSQIEVLTGDGAAVNVIYNQSELGAMGAYGEVVNRIYTASGILIPTATFTPSPTITPTFTITPRPSATPRSSATPRPSATPSP